MSRRKKILLIVLTVFIIIQFFQPDKNDKKGIEATDITKIYFVPDNVKAILKNSCYDCHSNSTKYPWYTSIQPLGWWMDSHIREGKSELNFNEFGSYTTRRQKSKLKSIGESIEDGSMPLSSYTIIHQRAKLSNEEKLLITKWLTDIRTSSAQKQ